MENVPGEPGSSPSSTAHSPDWHTRFNWTKGTRLETHYDGDWWESVIVDVDAERGALLHYVGGEDSEDEWIPLSSTRLRPPQSEAEPAEPSGLRADVVEPAATRPSQHRPSQHAVDADGDGDGESSAQRPMRRSRMLSDDARLALQLQEEELKAARGMHAVQRKRSKPSARKDPPKQRKVEPPKHSAPPPSRSQPPTATSAANRRTASLKFDPAQSAANRAPASRAPASSSSSSKPKTSSLTRTAPAPGSRKQPMAKEPVPGAMGPGVMDSPGFVAVQLVPDETVEETAPRLKKSLEWMQLKEDETIMSIKRRVKEEVLPHVEASQIEIRTQSNIICGQDHSMKYVRTFLWPPSKGDLTLLYRKAKDSLL